MRVLENGGTIEQHNAAVAAATAMKFDGVNCPTPGCDGKSEGLPGTGNNRKPEIEHHKNYFY